MSDTNWDRPAFDWAWADAADVHEWATGAPGHISEIGWMDLDDRMIKNQTDRDLFLHKRTPLHERAVVGSDGFDDDEDGEDDFV